MLQKEDMKQVKQEKVYTWKDLEQFKSKQIYSSIGRMVVSNKKTSGMYSFGTGTRKNAQKIF